MSAVVPTWSSLEVAKLLVQALIPLSLFTLGIVFDRRSKEIQQLMWVIQKNIEWRQALFTATIEDLNKIYCAFNYVGDWRDFSPPEIISAKRRLERQLRGYAPLLNSATIQAFDQLMDVSFETQRGRGEKIRLRCNVAMYQGLPSWKEEFELMFVPEAERTRRIRFQEEYENFISAFFKNIEADIPS